MGGIRLYTLLIISVLASGLITLLPLALSGSDALARSYREAVLGDMEDNAKLLALSLPGGIAGRNQDEVAGLVAAARAAGDTRYTIILRDGAVFADSDEDSSRMENHANRPEVRAALAGGTGWESRISSTMGDDWLYVATPLADGNVIRAGASLADMNGRLQQWWRRALYGFAVSLVVLVLMAVFVARRLSRPLAAAAEGAERYAAGDFSFRIPLSGSHENRRLARAMGVMAQELSSRFRLITRQREEMRLVFENMTEGILAVDAEGDILLSNSAAETMLGIDKTSSGRYGVRGVRNADLLDLLRDTLASAGPQEKELHVRAGEGRDDALILAHAVHIEGNVLERDGGRGDGVLAVLRDVTQLRRLEVMRRDFVANVSHELRTPITSIQSCLETMHEDGSLSGENVGFVDMALRNTRRMGAIVGNLLFLAGMESDSKKSVEAPEKHDVAAVLREAADLTRDEANARSVSVEITCPEGLTAMMNPKLITHAVVNLIDNAIKYGPENGDISVTAVQDGGAVDITVSDHGPGIAVRHQSRVFERFYRVDGVSRIKKGTGLGLAIVKHIALSHGGDIGVESEIGAGSRFTLRLPGA